MTKGKKKDFSILENESGVYSRISEATSEGRKPRRSDYTEEEKAAAIAAMNTQGKKGMKYPKELRIGEQDALSLGRLGPPLLDDGERPGECEAQEHQHLEQSDDHG